MSWIVEYIRAAEEDLRALDKSQQIRVLKAIRKVSINPLPAEEGGYGKLLGNKQTANLSGYLKIKPKRASPTTHVGSAKRGSPLLTPATRHTALTRGDSNSIALINCFLLALIAIKLPKSIGVRVVYSLVREKETMKIIIISVREDNEVYKTAASRITKKL